MATELTDRQQEILDYIQRVIETEGMSPTVQEIQREFGFRSPNAVQTHLSALQKKGVVERRGRMARTLRVIGNGNTGAKEGGRTHNAHPDTAAYSASVPLPGQLEMGVDVFFNAKHIVTEEFDGDVHAHSWRLRASVLVQNQNGNTPLSLNPNPPREGVWLAS